MVGPSRHNVVHIGAEDQLLVAALAIDRQFHGKKGDVLDIDAAAFGRGHEPMGAVYLTTQDGGKELNQRQPPDRSPAIKPSTVAGDAHVEVAAVDRQPPPGEGATFGGIAGAGILHQARTSRRV